MKHTAKFLRGGDYTAPKMEVCSFEVEQGFFVSQNPNLNYGGPGAAGGDLGNGGEYEL